MSEYCMGEMIKRTRKMQNMSQEELAFGICSVSTLSRIENGLETPARATFEKMIERLGGIKGQTSCDTAEDEAYRCRYLAVRNVIRSKKEMNDSLMDEYGSLGRNDTFLNYIEAVDSFDDNDINGCISLLMPILGAKGVKPDLSKIDYVLFEPYEVHAFILLSNCYREKGEYAKSGKILVRLKKYLEESFNFGEIYGELYIVLLTEYADLSVKKGAAAEGIAFCSLALNEIECRGKTFLKKKVFDIKAVAYEAAGKRELGHEYRNYVKVLTDLIKGCSEERNRPVEVAMFNF